jgi:nitrite reductase/ring-hydroxylating ferredoxin subunit/Fe-S cluster biogenesis protein NfuA
VSAQVNEVARPGRTGEGAAASDDPAAELQRLVDAITGLEAVVEGWQDAQQMTVQALKTAIEDLNKEALRRLIRALKDEPAANLRLREALADPLVYGVLRFHGLVKVPLQERVAAALDEVRPLLQGHDGDVELVAINPPDSVEIRLLGSCHGCPASSQTLAEGVEKAIRAHAPEITRIVQVSRPPETPATARRANGESTVHFISPFARHAQTGWVDAAALDEIPQAGVVERTVRARSVLLSRDGAAVSCFDNRCAHLGMPLEMGAIEDGVITCPYHGFRYLLATGECVTAPEVQLKVHAVRVQGGRVQVRLEE